MPVDNVAPTISSASPADGATKVSVLSDIQVTFSENLGATAVNFFSGSLAATTVNSFIVTLTYNNPEGADNIRGTASYDSTTKTMTFSPLKPLNWDTTYKLTLSGVKDLAGNAMSDTTLSFTTYINPSSLEIFYSSGSVNSYVAFTYDANGNRTQEVWYSGFGADNAWFTADDVVQHEFQYETSL